MPELPEVEFCRRALTKWTAGRRVVDVEVRDPRVVRARRTDRPTAGRPDARDALWQAVSAGPAAPPERHGKRLLWPFGDRALLLHLGMTGKWSRVPTAWAKVGLHLDDGGAAWFCDPRLLGGIVPTTLADGRVLLAEGLGPDVLTSPGLPPLRGQRAVKVALMDQAWAAGLGNVQAMEALWRAGIHPATPCERLDREAQGRLRVAIREQLEATLAALGDGDEIVYVEEDRSANPFPLYQRTGQPCPRCGETIRHMVQAGRSTWWCPTCQPSPRTPG